MSTEPPTDNPLLQGDSSWLTQFYTSSKTTFQTEFSEVTDTAQEQPASQLSTLPADKYVPGDKLGSGGMKLVRRALDKNAARDVAMAKMLDPEARAKKISRFIREARIAAALEHPNIVPIYDIGVDNEGKPYFTMKLLGGETLHSILQKMNAGDADYRKRYPLSKLLQIFLGVCNAVSFAHSRGVIHLDLKPANIQVGDFGEVLVLDWGLAKVLDKDPAQFPHRLKLAEGLRDMPSEGVVRGTPGFMGPEQSRGEYASLNEHTDIFSLGAVLYTILKCTTPGKKERAKPTTADSATTAQDTPKPAPIKAAHGFKVPPALEAVAVKAMARQPGKRYQTVGELGGDVQAFLDGYATKAQQAGAITLLRLLIRRHNVVTSLICVSILIVFGVFAVSIVRISNSERSAVQSEAFAVQALKRMKADQEARRKLSLLAAPRVFQQAENSVHNLDYDQAVSTLEYTVTLDPDFNAAWWELGAIHLGRGEFDPALTAFEHASRDPDGKNQRRGNEDLSMLARKYQGLVRDAGGIFPTELRAQFANDLLHAGGAAWQYRLIALTAFFKNQNRNPETADFALIEQVLRALNPDAKTMQFSHEFTQNGLKVSLHGDRVNQLLPLAGLPITYFDLSDVGNVDLTLARDMPLVSVDLSGSRFGDLLPLTKISTLTELRMVNTHDKDIGRLRSMNQLKRIVVSQAEAVDLKKAMDNRSTAQAIVVE